MASWLGLEWAAEMNLNLVWLSSFSFKISWCCGCKTVSESLYLNIPNRRSAFFQCSLSTACTAVEPRSTFCHSFATFKSKASECGSPEVPLCPQPQKSMPILGFVPVQIDGEPSVVWKLGAFQAWEFQRSVQNRYASFCMFLLFWMIGRLLWMQKRLRISDIQCTAWTTSIVSASSIFA